MSQLDTNLSNLQSNFSSFATVVANKFAEIPTKYLKKTDTAQNSNQLEGNTLLQVLNSVSGANAGSGDVSLYAGSSNGVLSLKTITAGSNIVISELNNTITISSTGGGGGGYTLPTASAITLGGIKVGAGLSIAGDGTLTANVLSVPVTSVAGKIGDVTLVAADISGLSTVATSGNYNDLANKPVIPAAQVNSDWNAVSGVAQILNKPLLSTVATTGSYNDLANKPVIPAAQVNSDWNAASGVAQILNKPVFSAVATSGNYSDLSGTPSLSAVAISGNYSDLVGAPSAYALPTASSTVLGGIKVGSGLSVAGDGTLSADAGTAYILPTASPSVLGGVKIGTGITVAGDGTISALDTSAVNALADARISNWVGAAPAALDTLNELASALGNNPNFSTDILTQLGLKANQVDLDALISSLNTGFTGLTASINTGTTDINAVVL